MSLVDLKQKEELMTFATYYKNLSIKEKKIALIKLITPLQETSPGAESTISLLSMPLIISEKKLDKLFDAIMFDIYYYRVEQRYDDYKKMILQ